MRLRSYQLPHAARILAVLRERGAAHDGSDTGVGKTFCAAWVAKEMNVETLVICPLSVCAVWRKVLADAGVTATVMNYESAHRRLGKVKPWGSGSFFAFDKVWPLTIIDEAHRLGGDTSLNSKMGIAAKRGGGKVLTLSATAASSILKMRALGFILGLHNLKNHREWLVAHGVKEFEVKLKNGRRFKQLNISKERQQEAMTALHDQIFQGGRGSRMRIADIAGFPRTQIEVRLLSDTTKEFVRLSDELQAFYRQRNALAQYATDELAKIVYWRNAAETAKIPHLLDMAEDALEDSRVAVFANFNRTVDELLAAAHKRGWKSACIRGDQSAEERRSAIERFQRNELDLIVCNIQAGGVGVSLHDSATQVPRTALICPTWNGVDLKQTTGRVWRDGGGYSRQFIVYFDHGIERNVARSVAAKLDNLALLNDRELDGSMDGAEEKNAKLANIDQLNDGDLEPKL